MEQTALIPPRDVLISLTINIQMGHVYQTALIQEEMSGMKDHTSALLPALLDTLMY